MKNNANARLIAAAPELLAALRMATEFIYGHNECLTEPLHSSDRQWNEYCIALLDDCKAAIAKAEGEGGEWRKDMWTVLFRPNHVPFPLLAFECRAEDGDEAESIFRETDYEAEIVHTSLGDTEDVFKDYERYLEGGE